ncbi:DegT/DnrJ/EryC1/StrS family aminotransferase [Paenibacillus antri]|uniref:DegT/DnrJ/EryC1/StrS family aminotransferase n=1 Tax=Paenibacillus antri TaxID=2582848 RepID=A0A5R9G8L3_9BACL|nr:DegT/DnrJ/EryC1/StrS family aminotransferase [Paenibacillus antri]TLS51409.1 DegT/DnrJ/EryC1/StrS family aminotransferase [Paenibacillus antri]
MEQEKLALMGGGKTKTTPYGTGKRFGEEELKELSEALEQNTLFYHHGRKVKKFLQDFNEIYSVPYSVAVSSGTAAIHTALGAAGISVGDEVITSPITDQGTLIGILYQNAIPVFADLEADTYNMSPASIESKITSRTKAIVVVHLAGNACDMDPIMDIARRHGLKVIEDCAQSYLTYYKGRLAGTIGDFGCFSTNDFKHISTGDGGMVTVNSEDEELYLRTHAFADKNFRRFGTDVVVKDLHGLAPNYRMTELQGAVGIAQLKRLKWVCERRGRYGESISAGIRGIPGVLPHRVTDGSRSSFWFYMFRVDESALGVTRDEFSKALAAEGVPNQAGYIPRVMYLQPMFLKKEAYLGSRFPFDLSDIEYKAGDCPEAEKILETAVRLQVSEFFTEQDAEETARAIRKVALHYAAKAANP